MSFSLRRSAQKTFSTDPQYLPERGPENDRNATQTRHSRLSPKPNRDEKYQSDYFSRSKELLSSPKMGYKSPQADRPEPESLRLHFSGMKSPSALRSSLSATNRNRVKFDLGNQESQRNERLITRESNLSVERNPVIISDKLSPTKLDVFPSTHSTFKHDKAYYEDLSQRINSLEKRMDTDHHPFSAKEQTEANTLFNARLKSPQQTGFSLKNDSQGSQDMQFSDLQFRRSRSKISAAEEPGSRLERPELQDSRGEDGKFSKTYIDHLKSKYNQKYQDLELKYKEKCNEFDEYKKQSTLKLDQLKDELKRNVEKHTEEVGKLNRDFEFQKKKQTQEASFEIKGLQAKAKDMEEELSSVVKKFESVRKELEVCETANKDLTIEKKVTTARLEEEIAVLREQSKIRLQNLTEKYDMEKKNTKETYEKLVNELAAENKQMHKKLSDDIMRRDRRLKELEREKEDIHRSLSSKVEGLSHEVHVLQETNKAQRKNLEECRSDVLKLSSQLDDRRREIYILETQIEMLKSEKAKYESEWLKGDKYRRSGVAYSNKGFETISPEKLETKVQGEKEEN